MEARDRRMQALCWWSSPSSGRRAGELSVWGGRFRPGPPGKAQSVENSEQGAGVARLP